MYACILIDLRTGDCAAMCACPMGHHVSSVRFVMDVHVEEKGRGSEGCRRKSSDARGSIIWVGQVRGRRSLVKKHEREVWRDQQMGPAGGATHGTAILQCIV